MSTRLIKSSLAWVIGAAIIGLPATAHASEYPPPPPTSDRPTIAATLKPASLKPASVTTPARTSTTSVTPTPPGR